MVRHILASESRRSPLPHQVAGVRVHQLPEVHAQQLGDRIAGQRLEGGVDVDEFLPVGVDAEEAGLGQQPELFLALPQRLLRPLALGFRGLQFGNTLTQFCQLADELCAGRAVVLHRSPPARLPHAARGRLSPPIKGPF